MAADPGGTIAEEAARLLAAFSRGPDGRAAHDGEATDGSSCRWCPHCHAVGLIRDASPEARAQLAAAATALVLALREAVDQAGRAPAERGRNKGAAPGEGSQAPG